MGDGMTDVIDFGTRKKVEKIEVDDGTSVATFLNILKKRCKEEKYTSIFVVTISENDHCDWGFVGKDEKQKCLAYMTIDDLKEDIKRSVFPEIEIELDEDE